MQARTREDARGAGIASDAPPWLRAQISKAILGDDDRLRLPRFLDDENNRDLEVTGRGRVLPGVWPLL